MWPFSSSTTLGDCVLRNQFVEYHCHLLPGVDDGARTMEESLRMLRLYEEWGIRKVWLTPHIMEDFPNTVERLSRRLDELKAAYSGPVELRLAAEHMLDGLFNERLSQGQLLPLGEEKRYMLVETSYFNPPYGMNDFLDRIKSAGYIPLLAHPERYMYMDEREYKRLHEERIAFQLDLFSLVGGYGSEARRRAEWLLKQGYYLICGTDMHRQALSHPDLWQQKLPKKVALRVGELVRKKLEE